MPDQIIPKYQFILTYEFLIKRDYFKIKFSWLNERFNNILMNNTLVESVNEDYAWICCCHFHIFFLKILDIYDTKIQIFDFN